METRLENVRAAARAQSPHDPGFEPARLVQALCEALAAGHPAPDVAEAAGHDVAGMLQILRTPPAGGEPAPSDPVPARVDTLEPPPRAGTRGGYSIRRTGGDRPRGM